MFKLIIIAIIQSAFLAVAQYFMKIGVERVVEYSMTWAYFRSYLNWQLGLSLLLYIIAMIIYLFMLKNYDLSIVYPLTSISYIFTILLAMFLLGETVSVIRWVGILLVMLGVGMIAK
ncbi:MAG: EamA family transporter [Bacteroidales bacterium]|nr:EamA family transporter [Bacteroidales bacterium]MBO7528724.1 EamA family transporter [Bacteroidales bacterium]MBQ3843527.1 EamA family transporter [Bacteroidales bacterium]